MRKILLRMIKNRKIWHWPRSIGCNGKRSYKNFEKFNIKKSSYDLEIEKNLHSLDVIHSVYNNVKNKIYVK